MCQAKSHGPMDELFRLIRLYPKRSSSPTLCCVWYRLYSFFVSLPLLWMSASALTTCWFNQLSEMLGCSEHVPSSSVFRLATERSRDNAISHGLPRQSHLHAAPGCVEFVRCGPGPRRERS